jgi:hypothetical protein
LALFKVFDLRGQSLILDPQGLSLLDPWNSEQGYHGQCSQAQNQIPKVIVWQKIKDWHYLVLKGACIFITTLSHLQEQSLLADLDLTSTRNIRVPASQKE